VKSCYKQTEVGVIPEDWKESTIGQEFDVRLGKMVDAVKNHGALKPYLGNVAVKWGTIDLSEVQTMPMAKGDLERFRLRRGDLLVCEGRGVGRSAIWEDQLPECYYQKALHRLRARQGFDPRFMIELFRYWVDQGLLANFVTESTIPHLTKEKLVLIPLAVPSPAEQRAIVGTLSDVDGLLGGLDRLIAKKRDLKQAAMQQLLTGQTRLPGFHGEWTVVKLKSLYAKVFKKSPLSSADGRTLGAYPLFVSGGEAKRIDLALFQNTEALIVSDGGVFDVKYFAGDFSVTDHCFVICLKGDMRFYFQWMSLRKAELDLMTFKGSGLRNLDKPTFGKIEAPLPPPAEQTAIAEVLTAMDAELAALEQRREKTRALKQAMMQELLTGRIRLVSSLHVATEKPAHNWQINEAVIIGALALQFGTEAWPLPRKRRVKLTYLLHRHAEGKAEGYLKKAAGPYNPKTKYQGPEGIALKNGYVREHNNGKYAGLIADGKVAQAEQYFAEWYPGGKEWVEQFRFSKTDDLEVLSTVDMAIEDLKSSNRAVSLEGVKEVIHAHPEWEAKLSRSAFSDANIAEAMSKCNQLFMSSTPDI
jgi:type I restriction enzyme S subunit